MAVRATAIKEPEEMKEVEVQRPGRAKLTAEEALRRMQDFATQRKEDIAAVVRKDKN